MKITVDPDHDIATVWEGGVRIGQYDAEHLDYIAADTPYLGCSCGSFHCTHESVVYWGIKPSHEEKVRIIERRKS